MGFRVAASEDERYHDTDERGSAEQRGDERLVCVDECRVVVFRDVIGAHCCAFFVFERRLLELRYDSLYLPI